MSKGMRWRRYLQALVVTSLFLGLILAFTSTTSAAGVPKYTKQVDSYACASLHTDFINSLTDELDARAEGDINAMHEAMHEASAALSAARGLDCLWPGNMSPDSKWHYL